MVGPVKYGIASGLADVLKTGVPNLIAGKLSRDEEKRKNEARRRDADYAIQILDILSEDGGASPTAPAPANVTSGLLRPAGDTSPAYGAVDAIRRPSLSVESPEPPAATPAAPGSDQRARINALLSQIGDPTMRTNIAQSVFKRLGDERTAARTRTETDAARTGLRTALSGDAPDFASAADYATRLPNGAAILNSILDYQATQATNTAKTEENQRKQEAGTTLARRLGEIGNRRLTAAEFNELNPLSLLAYEKPLVDYGREIAESNALIGQRQRERPVATPEEAQRTNAIRQFQQSIRMGMPTYDTNGMVNSRRRMTDREIDDLLAQLSLTRDDVGLPSTPSAAAPSIPSFAGRRTPLYGPSTQAPTPAATASLTAEQQGVVNGILADPAKDRAWIQAKLATETAPDRIAILNAALAKR